MVSSNAVMGLEWTFIFLSYVLVSARVYVRVWMRRDRLYWSDCWMMAALASAQGLVICDTLTYQMNAMDNFAITSVSLDKIRFATGYLFDVGIYLTKFSILAFYYNLVPLTNPHMRIALYVLTAITGICALVTFMNITFWCGPNPSVNWSSGNDACSVFESMVVMRVNWSMNFFTEVLNLIYPFPLIRGVKISSRRERISLGVIFTMGFITIAVSIGRFVMMLHVDNDITIYIWATAEMCIAIMIVALTALRPLLRKIAYILSSNITSSDTKSVHTIYSLEHQSRTKARSARPLSGSHWRNSNKTHQSRVIAIHQDPTGSQVELNNIDSVSLGHCNISLIESSEST
ncbi:hypothetical protein BGZ61DRAFT_491420 [Ilyonectria robusta]|uniref:uncharacterized protein n=1 Tax=Ilyonectria robusta TaxID=1079257 RepID=UPI001E8EEC47|nr:uncharacterized protein BGZ61DRAFT_491420 [Ilyonectria robusta]KAH8733912.1 hypothetical protein BGZ61DRAFT_491420 [Ilyonectria robusta]